jgi:hypothetical protein
VLSAPCIAPETCIKFLVRFVSATSIRSLLTRVKKWSALESWGLRITKRSGIRKANVAVAQKTYSDYASDVAHR